MNRDPDPRSVTSHVLFLRWREAGSPQGDAREQRLRALAENLVDGWKVVDRAVLQAPDGLAVVAAVPAAAALKAAQRAARDDAQGELAIALHHGPVEALPDAMAGARVAGDAIAAAGTLAAEAGSQSLRVSPAFHDALRSEGYGRRAVLRSLLGLGGIALVLGAGVSERRARIRAMEAREAYEAAHRPATIALDIRPGGEVLVDDEPKGMAPPLVKLSVAPGLHTIEVRSGKLKPVRMDIELKPGEELQFKHVFEAPPRPGRRAPATVAAAPAPSGPVEQAEDLVERTKSRVRNFMRKLTE